MAFSSYLTSNRKYFACILLVMVQLISMLLSFLISTWANDFIYILSVLSESSNKVLDILSKKRWGNDRSWSKGWVMYLLTCRVLALQRVYLRQLLCSRNLHHLIRTLLLWVGISCIYVWSSFILPHMQSLLLYVETIGGIKWSACYAISKSGNSKSTISKSSYVTLELVWWTSNEPLSLLTLVWWTCVCDFSCVMMRLW
jgi:hypothetical protein